jgi:bacillithiol biosynthesis cysteine-adding enzyme BshC
VSATRRDEIGARLAQDADAGAPLTRLEASRDGRFISIPAPPRWFDGAAYRPRIRVGERECWLLASEAIPFVRELPEEPPAPSREAPSASSRRAALASLYDRWKLPLPPAARASLDEAGDERALFVVAGQQPGFLGGPLYSIYKAITAVVVAEKLRTKWGRPVVPIFWVASEDHDLDEVRSAFLSGPDGTDREFRLPWNSDRRPVADWQLGDDIEPILADARTAIAGKRHEADVLPLIDNWKGRGLAEGFGHFIATLFGDHGLLVTEPESLRALSRPIFRRVVDQAREVMDAIDAGCTEVRARGIEPQVAARFPLFLIETPRAPGLARTRHHVELDGDRLKLDGGGRFLEREELEAWLDREPERFSSGALLRPLVQAHVFPTALTIGGPAEIAYFAQIGPLAELLGVPRPAIGIRFQATIIDAKAARAWDRLGLDPDRLALATRSEDLIDSADADGLLASADDLAERIGEFGRLLDRSSLANDAKQRIARGSDRLVASVDSLRERIDGELRRGDEDRLRLARAVWYQVYPGGVLQERRWSPIGFLARHGRAWLESLFEIARRDPLRLEHVFVIARSNEEIAS